MRLVAQIAALTLTTLALLCASEAQALTVKMRIDGPNANTEPPYYADFDQVLGNVYTQTGVLDTHTGNTVSLQDQQTFCVEKDANFSDGSVYNYTIDSYVTNQVNTLGGGANGQDPLSSRTAFLFNTFATNAWTTWAGANMLNMSSFVYAATQTSADALQNAIWYLENDIANFNGLTSAVATLAQTYVNAANKAVSGSISNATALTGGLWTQGIGDVRVMNLWAGTPTEANDRQSQLVLITPPPVAVPEPGSLALAGMGLGAFLLRRRRK